VLHEHHVGLEGASTTSPARSDPMTVGTGR
jgi:hypothetical protein